MKDSHLTSPLEDYPFRQFRVAELEEDDFPSVASELQRVFELNPEDYDHEAELEFLRNGGRIAIASRLIAVEAPHGPSDLEIEAVITLSGVSKTASVYMRDNNTPNELVAYLDSYIKDQPPREMERMPTASELCEYLS